MESSGFGSGSPNDVLSGGYVMAEMKEARIALYSQSSEWRWGSRAGCFWGAA